MDLNNKLESLKFISRTHRSQFDERRRYEWKVVFTLLTFYVLSVAAIYGGNVTVPEGWLFELIVWIFFLGLLVVTAIFLASVHMANGKNKSFAENAESAIDTLLGDETQTTPSLFSLENSKYWISWGGLFKRGKRGKWAWLWQVVTLSIFSITAATLLTLKLSN